MKHGSTKISSLTSDQKSNLPTEGRKFTANDYLAGEENAAELLPKELISAPNTIINSILNYSKSLQVFPAKDGEKLMVVNN